MKIKVYGTAWCGDCQKATRLLDKRNIPYDYIDLEHDESAAQIVKDVTHGYQSVPTIVFPNGSILIEPSREELEQALSQM